MVLPALLGSLLLFATGALAAKPTAEDAAAKAFEAFEAGRYAQASTHFLDAFERSGETATTMLHNAAKAAEKSGDVDRAITLWQRFVNRDDIAGEERSVGTARLVALSEARGRRGGTGSPVRPSAIGRRPGPSGPPGPPESTAPPAPVPKGALAAGVTAFRAGEIEQANRLLAAASAQNADPTVAFYLGWTEALGGDTGAACIRWERLGAARPPVGPGGLGLEEVLCASEPFDGKTAALLGAMVRRPKVWRSRVLDARAVLTRLHGRRWMEVDRPLGRIALLDGDVGAAAADLRAAISLWFLGFDPSKARKGQKARALVKKARGQAAAGNLEAHDRTLRTLSRLGHRVGPGYWEVVAPRTIAWQKVGGGRFEMGSGNGDESEAPVTRVEVTSFEIARAEITVEQYGRCVAAGACPEPGTGRGCTWKKKRKAHHPVNCVRWEHGRSFAAWVGGRLPSEAEWEFAARNGALAMRHPWGFEEAGCGHAVLGKAGGKACRRRGTAPACSLEPDRTRAGACDMIGNVSEWTEDAWHASHAGAAADGRPRAAATTGQRVVRGCSWRDVAEACRASRRAPMDGTKSGATVGFRVAR